MKWLFIERKFKFLLFLILGFVVFHLASVSIVNYFVDPYSFFGSVLKNGANKNKPKSNRRLIMPHHFMQGTYNAIILGSSRAMHISASSPTLANFKVYNFSMQGASVSEQLQSLKYSHEHQPLQVVIIGLDLISYLSLDALPFSKNKNIAVSSSNIYRRFYESTQMLLSDKAFSASRKTLKANKKSKRNDSSAPPHPPPADKHGKDNREGLLPAQKGILNYGGYNYYFGVSERQYVKRDGMLLNSRFNKLSPSAKIVLSQNLKQLDDIIAYCHENNISLKLFFSALHIRHLAMIEIADFWPLYAQWKIEVAKRITLFNAENSQKIILEDFAIINDLTTEPVPKSGSQNVMFWFYNGSHYTKAFSEYILAVLFNHSKFPSLHYQPTSNIIEQKIEKEHQRVLNFISKHKEFELMIKEFLCEENIEAYCKR